MPDALPERSRLDETLEKLSPVFFGDAGSRVGDVDVEFPAADFEPEIDGTFGGEFHGVAQKVGDHLNQPFAVRADVADGIFSVEGDPHRLFSGCRMRKPPCSSSMTALSSTSVYS